MWGFMQQHTLAERGVEEEEKYESGSRRSQLLTIDVVVGEAVARRAGVGEIGPIMFVRVEVGA